VPADAAEVASYFDGFAVFDAGSTSDPDFFEIPRQSKTAAAAFMARSVLSDLRFRGPQRAQTAAAAFMARSVLSDLRFRGPQRAQTTAGHAGPGTEDRTSAISATGPDRDTRPLLSNTTKRHRPRLLPRSDYATPTQLSKRLAERSTERDGSISTRGRRIPRRANCVSAGRLRLGKPPSGWEITCLTAHRLGAGQPGTRSRSG
jgi:hypothetical protein